MGLVPAHFGSLATCVPLLEMTAVSPISLDDLDQFPPQYPELDFDFRGVIDSFLQAQEGTGNMSEISFIGIEYFAQSPEWTDDH